MVGSVAEGEVLMGSLFLVIARALIASPLVISAVLAGLNYSGASASFAEAYPALAGAYPLVIGVKALAGLILIAGLPTHKTLAAVLALAVVAFAVVQAPFWHFIGDERSSMTTLFTALLGQAGGLIVVAAMPKR